MPIESNLHANLTEHLNSEIVLQTITSAAEALEWLRSTFLYVRISQNQEYYGFAKTLSKEKLDEKLQELCELSIVALEKQGMLTKETDGLVASTVFGKIMSHFYMSFETAKLLNQLKGNESQEELLNVLTRAPEFKDFLIRNNDRKCLNQIIDDNLKPLRYPILGKIKSVDLKISWWAFNISAFLNLTNFFQYSPSGFAKFAHFWLLIEERNPKNSFCRSTVNEMLYWVHTSNWK